MTQEDNELLLKDLCARLPYGVIGKCELDASYGTPFDTIFQTHKFDAVVYSLTEDSIFVIPLIENEDVQNFAEEEVAKGVAFSDFKPYLFPLSSMTEEQEKEYNLLRNFVPTYHHVFGVMEEYVYDNWESIDYLNAHHFDFRGLIEKGLAIDATGLNIYDKAKMNF